mmetsp:Transcript_10000/g.17190  ORF Transcript_10000/g.17190 Transcript_10000/m.17190 type:complete len:368 (-) Transcript_10000:257-1360(-)|eukprot:CAMPEP_0198211868 /NCGR_PEP_ID=MMETSP1445-20131203/25385_1 /TAXON_ID=36898 /ORGANISM="Pyramimonas sp., Strain CCMP2087" /LENGTH=367 /DNA_ID=CAMNT_0043886217 /DNA_START=155 /DNA_END=1258 /DNA_ORIENTATION=+
MNTDRAFMKPTAVQPIRPKTPGGTEVHTGEMPVYRNAEQDTVKSAFTSTAAVGIRSLPNALNPNFRQVLLKEALKEAKLAHKTEAGTGTGGKPDLSMADPLSVSVAPGQHKPDKYSPIPGVFSTYEYHHSEYGRDKEIDSEERRNAKEKYAFKDPFKISALPSIPKSVGAFNEFDYTLDPYEYQEARRLGERTEDSSKNMHGPMKPGGHVQPGEQMKIRLHELLTRLAGILEGDWPNIFLKVFEDNQGLIVACFDKLKMGQGANVTAYMNQMFRTNEVVHEFSLKRDTTRWGVMENLVQTVYFVFIPPWVHARIVHPELSRVPDCKPVPGISEPPLATGRVPFIPQTEGGTFINPVYVQTYATSFKV